MSGYSVLPGHLSSSLGEEAIEGLSYSYGLFSEVVGAHTSQGLKQRDLLFFLWDGSKEFHLWKMRRAAVALTMASTFAGLTPNTWW